MAGLPDAEEKDVAGTEGEREGEGEGTAQRSQSAQPHHRHQQQQEAVEGAASGSADVQDSRHDGRPGQAQQQQQQQQQQRQQRQRQQGQQGHHVQLQQQPGREQGQRQEQGEGGRQHKKQRGNREGQEDGNTGDAVDLAGGGSSLPLQADSRFPTSSLASPRSPPPGASSAGTAGPSGNGEPQQPNLDAQVLRCIVRKAGYVTYHPVRKEHCVHFCKFVEKAREDDVVAFFRQLLADLQGGRSVRDFHLQIVGSAHSGPSGFFVEVRFGESHDGPPADFQLEECIACHGNAPLFPGMTSQELYLAEYDSLHVRVSLDAQARPAFVITPLRHVEGLDGLDDRELADLFRTAARVMRREKLHFTRMVVNHGAYRNLPHLHLKIFLESYAFGQARKSWPAARIATWERLNQLRPEKMETACKFFKRTGKCRYGNGCRHQHVRQEEEGEKGKS